MFGTTSHSIASVQKDVLDHNANLAQSQENGISERTNVCVLPQKHSGMVTNAFATKIFTAITAYHVPLPESGITQRTNALAQLQKQYGLDQLANVPLDSLVIIALHVQLQDTGMSQPTNAFAKSHSSGTERNVFAHNLSSYTKEDAPNAQTDTLGKTINVKLALALSKIWKFSELESDTFIHL